MSETPNKVMFRAKTRRLCIWMRTAVEQIQGGHPVLVDAGHCIQFDDYLYAADATKKIKRCPGQQPAEMTEVEFLEMLENMKTYHVEKVVPEVAVEKPVALDDFSTFDLLVGRTTAELRSLFTDEEIAKHSLDKAPADKLVVTVMKLRKAIPSKWLEQPEPTV